MGDFQTHILKCPRGGKTTFFEFIFFIGASATKSQKLSGKGLLKIFLIKGQNTKSLEG